MSRKPTNDAGRIRICAGVNRLLMPGPNLMSMSTVWQQDGATRRMTAPVSLIVSAFAPVTDVRLTLTPQLRTDRGPTELLLLDLGCGRNRLGGSMLAQVKEAAESVLEHSVKVTLLAERWDPKDAGLAW